MLLDALAPEQVALALSAADGWQRHQRVSRAAELAVERARYEAGRAERAFCQVEPENRLVARTLEARWEGRLAALAEAEQALEAARDALPPLPGRAELEKLAADLPGLWHAPATSSKDRKRLLRTLIADVTLLPEPDPARCGSGSAGTPAPPTNWRGPRHPPRHRQAQPVPAVEMVRQLGPVTPAAELAGRLNAAGLATGHGRPSTSRPSVDPPRLQHPRPRPVCRRRDQRRRGRPPAGLRHRRHLLLDRAAQLDARRGPGNRLCIPWSGRIQAACRERIAASGHLNPAARRTRPRPRGSPRRNVGTA